MVHIKEQLIDSHFRKTPQYRQATNRFDIGFLRWPLGYTYCNSVLSPEARL
jgi:hypothetical protein